MQHITALTDDRRHWHLCDINNCGLASSRTYNRIKSGTILIGKPHAHGHCLWTCQMKSKLHQLHNSYQFTHVCTCKVCSESLVKSWCDRFKSLFQSRSNGPCGKVLRVPLIHSKDAVLQMCFFQSSPVEGCPCTYSFWCTSIPIAQYQLNKWSYLSGYYHVDAWCRGWVWGGSVVCTLNFARWLFFPTVTGLYKSSKPIGFPTLYVW